MPRKRQPAGSARLRPAAVPVRLNLRILPLTAKRWPDVEKLFGPRGACAGCWCMFWRLPRARWEQQRGDGNRDAFCRLVEDGPPPGLIAYDGREPIGWVAVAPRSDYPRLANSRTLKAVDDRPVWSATCFYVARPYRRRGVTLALLEAAKDFVRGQGGEILEGYPVVPKKGAIPDAFAYTGILSVFKKAGFTQAIKRGAQPVMRCTLSQ